MPLTFLSHQAPVLPLKIVAPRAVDGTALVLGSMAPDLFHAVRGTGAEVDASGTVGGVALAVVVTVALTWLVHRVVAAPVAATLPDAGPLHLRDYGRLDAWRWPRTVRGWAVLWASALIGVLSQLLLDGFTHGDAWGVERFDALRTDAVEVLGRSLQVYDVLQVVASLVGAAITVWCVVHIGRHRLLVRWYPGEPARRLDPVGRRLLVGWSVAGLAAGVALAAATHDVGALHDAGMRVLVVAAAGVAIGSAWARPHLVPADVAVPTS